MYQDTTSSHPYFVYTPSNYIVGTEVPLFVMLHGCTQTAEDFAVGTRMNQLAEQYGFIVVYPQQTRKANQTLCWNWFKSAHQFRNRGEPAMIAHIVQDIRQDTSRWTIDSNQIYVAGVSAGASMAVILGATYPDIFAAIGVHSGIEYQAVTNTISALKVMRHGGPDPVLQGKRAYEAMGSSKRVVPTIVFQGTRDSVVSPISGDQVVQQWIETNQLGSHGFYPADFKSPTTTTSGQVPEGYAYTVYSWRDSRGKEVQTYWKIHGLGHAWSGGSSTGSYTDPQGPNASEAIYQFFMNHPMVEAIDYDISPWRKIQRAISHPLQMFKIKSQG
ncbi:MAG TPA: PHB depolymerase family esterase [Ktedonobacteraceae bacterium]|nr:PHB depolymerase family esterase [Ktedonobacteraceae bacterium]